MLVPESCAGVVCDAGRVGIGNEDILYAPWVVVRAVQVDRDVNGDDGYAVVVQSQLVWGGVVLDPPEARFELSWAGALRRRPKRDERRVDVALVRDE